MLFQHTANTIQAGITMHEGIGIRAVEHQLLNADDRAFESLKMASVQVCPLKLHSTPFTHCCPMSFQEFLQRGRQSPILGYVNRIIITYPKKRPQLGDSNRLRPFFQGKHGPWGWFPCACRQNLSAKFDGANKHFVYVHSRHQKPVLEALQYRANVLMVALIQAILGHTSADDEIINVNAGASDGIRNALPHTISVLLTAPMVEHPVHHVLELSRSIFHSHREHPPLQGAQGSWNRCQIPLLMEQWHLMEAML